MLSNKKIVCPNNLINVAKKSGIIDAAIANAGEIFPMESVHKAVEHNLIKPIFIGNENEIKKYADKLKWNISKYKIIDEILKYSTRIKMLIFEFHLVDNNEEIFYKSIKKIKEYFEIIHIHGNNHFSKLNSGLPFILEITLINKKFAPKNPEHINNFPIPGLDYPNNPYKDDLIFSFEE